MAAKARPPMMVGSKHSVRITLTQSPPRLSLLKVVLFSVCAYASFVAA